MNLELETVWSGNTWRTFPQPVVAVSEDEPTPYQALHRTRTEAVYAATTSVWEPGRLIAKRTGIPIQDCWVYLRRLVERGEIEMQHEPSRSYRGRKTTMYRRKVAA